MSQIGPKVAVVTGGTRGLGRALSLELAKSGYGVVALWSRDMKAAQSLSDEWGRLGLSGVCIQSDLQKAQPLQLPIPADADELVLVHNAACPFKLGPMHLASYADFQAQWAVAVGGLVLCTQTLIRAMARARCSTIVVVSSRALVDSPPKGFAAYVSAKAASVTLARSIASEYRARGVRVFVVAPGFMDTSLTANWDEVLRNSLRAGGISQPADVALNVIRLIGDPTLPACGETYDV